MTLFYWQSEGKIDDFIKKKEVSLTFSKPLFNCEDKNIPTLLCFESIMDQTFRKKKTITLTSAIYYLIEICNSYGLKT